MRFLEAEPQKTNVSAKIVIFGAPFENMSSYRKGSALGPAAIRKASQSIESYSRIFRRDLKDIKIIDGGDLILRENPEEVMEQIAQNAEKYLEKNLKIVVLGGDHSITVGVVKGALSVYPDLQGVVLDAHSDWRESYEGSPLSHACTVRRLWEMLEGKVWVVGARSFYGAEMDEVYVLAEELYKNLDPQRPIYISIDLDVLDPSICPGVGNPEPGGMSYGQIIEIFKKLRSFKIIGMDVVELHPAYDAAEISAVTAAKLVQEGIAAFWG
ncbi:MAG TPA: agmatinase [Peptococcaceae bacterium]|nr:MAG: Agmatinase [Clostridia bacterium 41_269]HBT20797.1 agmatinase [Peptococcaceae bacterium]